MARNFFSKVYCVYYNSGSTDYIGYTSLKSDYICCIFPASPQVYCRVAVDDCCSLVSGRTRIILHSMICSSHLFSITSRSHPFTYLLLCSSSIFAYIVLVPFRQLRYPCLPNRRLNSKRNSIGL